MTTTPDQIPHRRFRIVAEIEGDYIRDLDALIETELLPALAAWGQAHNDAYEQEFEDPHGRVVVVPDVTIERDPTSMTTVRIRLSDYPNMTGDLYQKAVAALAGADGGS